MLANWSPSMSFCTLWPRPFDLILIGRWGIIMDYPCAKFGNFSFSRFGFIVQTDSVTELQMIAILTWLLSTRVNKNFNKTTTRDRQRRQRDGERKEEKERSLDKTLWLKPSFHYLSWRPELTARQHGRALIRLVETRARQHGPSWRVMETGRPSTRVVETGLYSQTFSESKLI